MITTRNFDYWRHLADCNLLWRTTDNMAERSDLLDQVANKCVEQERAGQITSVWHSVSLVLGTPCNCIDCARRL